MPALHPTLAAPEEPLEFTVAITVWRRERLLAHALSSVLRQSRPPREIRVYSDGPSRIARETVAQLADRAPIVYRAVRRRRRCWGNHLRRLALEEASGSHVVMLGHDCLFYRGCLEAHARNLEAAPDALSVVPVDYWRETRYDRVLPDRIDPTKLVAGQIDLLCLAFPRRLSLELDCFGEPTWRKRYADFLAFDALRRRLIPRVVPGEPQAAHF